MTGIVLPTSNPLQRREPLFTEIDALGQNEERAPKCSQSES